MAMSIVKSKRNVKPTRDDFAYDMCEVSLTISSVYEDDS